MDNLYMDIQVEEPTIEYNFAKPVEQEPSVSPVVEEKESKVPFMYYEVPEPVLQKKGPFEFCTEKEFSRAFLLFLAGGLSF